MNPRIKLLAEQAGYSKEFLAIGLPNNMENFAELIIQECLNICEDMGDNGKDGHYCADKITKTFFR
jgi:hypothetical protein